MFAVEKEGQGDEAFVRSIASEEVYRERWLPVAEAVDAEFFRKFLTGMSVKVANYEEISREYRMILQYTLENPSSTLSDGEVRKFGSALEDLGEYFSRNPEAEVYVG